MEPMIVNGLDITQLTDDDLYERLKNLGAPTGPIVDSTRNVYQKKLYQILSGKSSKSSNGICSQNHLTSASTEHSDIEDEEVKIESPKQQQSARLFSSFELPRLQAEHHPPSTPESFLSSPVSYIPTPRRSLHSDSASSSFVAHSFQDSPNFTPFASYRSTSLRSNGEVRKMDSNGSKTLKKNSPWFTTLVEVFVILFLAVVGYVFYQEACLLSAAEKDFMESSSQNEYVN